MRIIAGQAKGRRLAAPAGAFTRPTAGRVKEAIFSVLAAKTAGAVVLDAFAGTGALGLEALSRGAERAVFLEKTRAACESIRGNIRACGFEDKAILFPGDSLRNMPKLKEPFDLVFIDPPYTKGLLVPALRLVFGTLLLADGAVVVVETDAEGAEYLKALPLDILKESRYGDTWVIYCCKMEVE
ncbi:MAG: 16S rRNA (guanine(966)-N(2))-methyltransferase RsmD [Clostridiales bacterium]|nr:16S rRNA (guanine(966)-N(2))-methyltransferase RsmD [Clostridiales bacterium]